MNGSLKLLFYSNPKRRTFALSCIHSLTAMVIYTTCFNKYIGNNCNHAYIYISMNYSYQLFLTSLITEYNNSLIKAGHQRTPASRTSSHLPSPPSDSQELNIRPTSKQCVHKYCPMSIQFSSQLLLSTPLIGSHMLEALDEMSSTIATVTTIAIFTPTPD